MLSSQAIIKLAPVADFSNVMAKNSNESVCFCTGASILTMSLVSSYLKAPQVSVSLLRINVHLSWFGIQYKVYRPFFILVLTSIWNLNLYFVSVILLSVFFCV